MNLPTALSYLMCAGSAIWIAAVLNRLRSSTTHRAPRYGRRSTSRQIAVAFGRLFSSIEEAFIRESAQTSGELARKFRRNRRRVFDLHLQQLKMEHDVAAANLREVAVRNDRPDFAVVAIRKAVTFNLRYWTLRLQLAAGLTPMSPTVRWAAAWHPASRQAPVAVADAALQHTAVR